jgi:hypothetical protein
MKDSCVDRTVLYLDYSCGYKDLLVSPHCIEVNVHEHTHTSACETRNPTEIGGVECVYINVPVIITQYSFPKVNQAKDNLYIIS